MKVTYTRSVVKKILSVLAVLFLFGVIAYFCAFKVSDTDFWWHVKAGEIMLATKSLIWIEPFAYTRMGAPYLAQHEWLAQIVLALIFKVGGSMGVILFRMFIAMMVAGMILMIDRKNVAVNALLIALMIPLALPGFRERPQLFTLLFFTGFLVVLMRWMDCGSPLRRTKTFLSYGGVTQLFLLQVLWVNTHGAAALLGLILFAFFILQEGLEGFWEEGFSAIRRSWVFWVVGSVGLSAALLLSPSGFANITYLFNLVSDQTVQFIREWQPRDFSWYMRDLWWLWSAAFASVLLTRRKIVFSVLTLLFVGYLSRQAIRHEVLFVIAAIAVIVYQFKWNGWWNRMCSSLSFETPSPLCHGEGFCEAKLSRTITKGWAPQDDTELATTHSVPGTVIRFLFTMMVLFFVGWHAHVRAQEFSHHNHLRGFGTFEPLAGAYAFLEQNGVQGNMFNTYGDGGYLLYRGYPDRKIFIDGRNVDYGFAFMARALNASVNEELWKELEEEFTLTYAVIGYHALLSSEGPFPYTGHLGKNPLWTLVYLDDWGVVYMKNIPENQKIIQEYGYDFLTPEGLDSKSALREVKQEQLPALEKELQRLMRGDTKGIKGLLLLARLYLFSGYHANAIALSNEAKRRSPQDFEPYYILAMVAAKRGDWETSSEFFDEAITRGKYDDLEIDRETLDEIYRRAGR